MLFRSAFWVYALSLVPSVFLSRYLERIGSPRRDPTTGALISAGEDLARPGIIEWCFDVVYITWACQVGSGAFGVWVWWLYLIVSPVPRLVVVRVLDSTSGGQQIPLYAAFRLWSTVISPMVLGRSGSASPETEAGADGLPYAGGPQLPSEVVTGLYGVDATGVDSAG